MTSFSSLLSSISGQPQAPQPRPQSTGAKAPTRAPLPLEAQKRPTENALIANNAAAGVKRRSSDNAPSAPSKVARVAPPGADRRPPAQPGQNVVATTKPAVGANTPTTAYRGTARPAGPPGASKGVAPRPVSKPVPASATASSASANLPAGAGPAKQKRGFAALMEKAKASQEASKIAATTGIQHKPMEKVNRRDREKMQKEAALQQQKAKKAAGRAPAIDRSRGDHAVEAKPPVAKKAQETSYKGTMKKAPVELGYKGTMRPVGAAPNAPKPAAKKGMGQDRYGGYASWSDLDDVEDDEEDYDSEGSSDMEGGFDDVEREEFAALRLAKREDQEALEEEDRLKREKMERKKRLLALNKSAAAKRRI